MSILNISTDTLLSSLTKYNPWWKESNYSYPFQKQREYFESFKDLALNKNIRRALILMGPRRVGKTVMLHQLISNSLKCKRFSSLNIFFISIDDPIYNNISLEELIILFHKKNPQIVKEQQLIIFDEIQYLKGWERHLKILVDKYPHIQFIASGSSASALKRQSIESGAGRFTDFTLPSLTFKEFIDLSPAFPPNDIKQWNQKLIDYINFGGYPEPIFHKEIQENVKKFIGRDIIDKVLLRDLPGLYGISDTQELNQLLTTIALNSGYEINLESLSKNSNITKNTIQKYLTYLESAFLIKKIDRIDYSGKKLKRVRNFKAYLTNPSIYSALFGQIKDTNKKNIGQIIETAIVSQFFHTQYSSDHRLYYARWKKAQKEFEVDLVITNEKYQPTSLIEIKWSDRHLDGRERSESLEGLLQLAHKHQLKKCIATSKTNKTKLKKIFNHVYKNSSIQVASYSCAIFCYHIGKLFLQKGGINEQLIQDIEKQK